MGVKCLFRHKWKVLYVESYKDYSWSKKGVWYLNITKQCRRCEKIDAELMPIYRPFTDEELKAFIVERNK